MSTPSTAQAPGYPARLTGTLDPVLSRWMWIFKWLLAIPHYLILVGLALAAAVVTVVAWFAILFTGRYPRPMFDFVVGVLRWNWRVAFYSYSALATDRYPPFTLKRTDYPADFEVDYPEHLSRGLVVVKSWLLAIPHYLVLAVLVGGGWSVAGGMDSFTSRSSTGFVFSLLGALILIAAVMLLFTGRYRTSIFNLVMGINRWVYRVIAYSALMTDTYPPFALQQGQDDEGSA